VTFSEQPASQELPRCQNGHSMAPADNFCPLCGARRQTTESGGPGTLPSTSSFPAYPGDGPVPAADDPMSASYQFGQPGAYPPPGTDQQPGGFRQPGTYPPGSYPAPGPYPSPQDPGYWPQQGGYAAPQTTSGLAIASLVLGLMWLFWLGSVLALVFGLISLSQIKRTNQKGRGLAIAGIVLGGLGVLFLVLAIIVAAVGGHTTSPGAF
jgi:hypothetical protein